MQSLVQKSMARFRCVGDACEDDCCGTWETLVDRASYERLAAAMPSEELNRLYERREAASPAAWARTRRREGCCPALEQGWCRIQRDHGVEALSDTCATYPRRLHRVHGRLEVSAHLSCPEVARLLLADDATELVPLDPASVPRDTSEARLASDDLRGYARSLLGVTAPLRTRLGFVNELARRFDAGEPLDVVWAELSQPDALIRLHESLEARPARLGAVMAAVSDVVFGRNGVGRALRPFLELRREARRALSGGSLPELLHEYRDRQDGLVPEVRAEIDRVLGQVAADWWFGRLHTESPTAVQHHLDLLLRLAAMRWLVLQQPELRHMATPAALQPLLVRVVYGFSRAFDHGADVVGRRAAGLNPIALARFHG